MNLFRKELTRKVFQLPRLDKKGIQLFPKFALKHSIIRAAVDTKQFYVPAQKMNFEHSYKSYCTPLREKASIPL